MNIAKDVITQSNLIKEVKCKLAVTYDVTKFKVTDNFAGADILIEVWTDLHGKQQIMLQRI